MGQSFCVMHKALAVDSDNYVRISVVDPLTNDTPVTGATVTGELFQSDYSTSVGACSVVSQGDGTYDITVPDTLSTSHGSTYRLFVTVDDGAGRHWEGWVDYVAARAKVSH